MPEIDRDEPEAAQPPPRLPDPTILLKEFDPTLFLHSKGVIAAIVADPMDFPATVGIGPNDWVPHRSSAPCSLVLYESGGFRLVGARLPCGHFDVRCPPDRVLVTFGLKETHNAVFNGTVMPPASFAIGPAGSRCIAHWPSDRVVSQSFVALGLPVDAAPAEWRATGDLCTLYETTTTAIRDLRLLAAKAFLSAAGLATPEQVEAEIRRIVEATTTALRRGRVVPAPSALGARGYLDLVDRIDAYLAANPSEPVRLEDVAAALKVSRRTIHNVMIRVRGLTLLAYVRLIRLRAVRLDLLRSPDVRLVKQAAMRNGFLHQGRFSKDYTDLFGESPSATLERRSTVDAKTARE
ncbi:MAG: helix-turn-helix domain-containing protein [Hyphomicrobiales bacterium]|nr:helix-turn-helix domain-containing protein [Hyphomicrobiales bacterium]